MSIKQQPLQGPLSQGHFEVVEYIQDSMHTDWTSEDAIRQFLLRPNNDQRFKDGIGGPGKVTALLLDYNIYIDET
jgi:hypothetical protein